MEQHDLGQTGEKVDDIIIKIIIKINEF